MFMGKQYAVYCHGASPKRYTAQAMVSYIDTMTDEPSDLLQKALRDKGFASVSEAMRHFRWIERLGISEASIRHHFNGTRGLTQSREVADVYAQDLGISRNRLMGLDDSDAPSANITIEGRARWGAWLDTRVFSEEGASPKIKATVSVPRSLGLGMRRAVVVEDASVNRAIRAGDYAIYEPISPEEALQLTSGYVYVIRHRGEIEERTVRKVLSVRDGKLFLGADSSDPKYAGTITYPSSTPSETVEIIGRVVGQSGPL